MASKWINGHWAMVSLHKEWINLGREEVRRIYFLIYMFGFFFPLEGSKWKAKILTAELNDSLSPSEGTSFGEAATPSTLINFFFSSFKEYQREHEQISRLVSTLWRGNTIPVSAALSCQPCPGHSYVQGKGDVDFVFLTFHFKWATN